MSTTPPGRTHLNTDPKLIEEFLNKGGKITKLKTGETSEQVNFTKGFYGRKKKETKPEEDDGQG